MHAWGRTSTDLASQTTSVLRKGVGMVVLTKIPILPFQKERKKEKKERPRIIIWSSSADYLLFISRRNQGPTPS
jgi:hypothetical protein